MRSFTADWVSFHHEIWQTLTAELAHRPDLLFLEVGSHEGRSACWWFDHVLTDPTSRLICIDPWKYDPHREAVFDANLRNHADQIVKIKALSRLALPSLDARSIDFAYVDGSHEAADVLLDGLLVLPLVKRGGIILFDDYQLGRVSEWDIKHYPMAGIDAFLALNDWRIDVIHRGYQLAVRVR